jgi:hypothetical protein
MFTKLLRDAKAIRDVFVTRYGRTPLEALLGARFRGKRLSHPPSAVAPLLAMEAPLDAVYYAMLGQIVLALRATGDIKVMQVVTQALCPGASRSLRAFLGACLHSNFLWRRKWEKLYGEFCDGVGYRAATLHAPWREAVYWWDAWCAWRGLVCKDGVAALEYRGIAVGDAVIDSYLRLRPSVSLDVRQPYLWVVIRRAFKDVASAYDYFREARPHFYLTFYATYIEHAVPARVATSLGIRTLCLGNLQDFCGELTPDHLRQTRRVDDYRTAFDAIPDRATKLAAADAAFHHRTSGGTDAATAYMRSSAYAIKTTEVPDVRGAAIIFLHDFYDSVHIYRWSIFHDFWEWACVTIENLQDSGRPFFIKPHPNQRAQSNAELAALKARYPQAKFLSSDISNRQLADAGMGCAVTVFGTVAAEMAYLGVPPISCGDNPHVGFEAFKLARSREEYRQLLADFPTFPRQPEKLKEQACIFYYMHNLNLDPADSEIRDKFTNTFFYLNALHTAGALNAAEIGQALDDFTACPGFVRFAHTLVTDRDRP